MKSMTQSEAPVTVRRSLVVNVPPERAWATFTGMRWWPLQGKHIGQAEAQEAVLEPRQGGRWFERGVDGSTCTWGRVLAWEPPNRLVLSWEISAQWKHDPAIQSEVEVRFTAEGAGTRVDLEHRKLEAYGARAADMAALFGSPGGWPGILADFAKDVLRAV